MYKTYYEVLLEEPEKKLVENTFKYSTLYFWYIEDLEPDLENKII